MAAFSSPPAASSAFLQSIIGRLVFSRSFFTTAAVTSAIGIYPPNFAQNKIGRARARLNFTTEDNGHHGEEDLTPRREGAKESCLLCDSAPLRDPFSFFRILGSTELTEVRVLRG